MANVGSVHSPPSFGKTVFVDTNLGTHLVTLLDDRDTVPHFKKKLMEDHRLCFPDVGDIEISALKVKRRGQLYHLSDTMFVSKAFQDIRKGWFLFLEARKVVKESENLQLQCIDSCKQVKFLINGVEPSTKLSDIDELGHRQESDHQLVKSKPSVHLSGADKEHPTGFDTDAEHGHCNHPETDSVKNIAAENQKESAAPDHNSLDPKLSDKEKGIATSSEFVDGSTRDEVKDVQQNLNYEGVSGNESAMVAKRTHKSKRKTKSLDYRALETHGPSGVSALTSATSACKRTESTSANGNVESEPRASAAPVVIEPSMTVRVNADFRVNSIEAGADIRQHKDNEIVVENAVSVKEASTLETPARKRRKVGKKPGKEDSVVATKPEGISPQPSLVDRQRASNLDAAEVANDYLEAVSGLTASPTAEKKKKRKRSSKISNISAAAAAAMAPGKADLAVVRSESCAISPSEKPDEPLTAAIEKETEMVEKNVDNAVGSRVAVLSAADNLQTAEFGSTRLLPVQESREPDPIGCDEKNATLMLEVANFGTLTTKNDGEATANEGMDGKSSKRKRKSKKAKTQVEEGAGIDGISSTGPGKDVDGGDGPDSVIRSVLQSLQQSNENEEKFEKVAKKSRKKTKKKHPLDVENEAVEEEEEVAPMVDSSKPGKTSATRQSSQTILEFENDNGIENGDPLLSRKKAEVFDSPRGAMWHELDGTGKGSPCNQVELCREKENAFMGDNFVFTQTKHDVVASGKKLDQVANGAGAAKPSNKKTSVKHPEGSSIDDLQSSMKASKKHHSSKRAQPASSSTSQISSKVKIGIAVSLRNKDQQSLGIGAIDDASHKLEKKDSEASNPNTSVKGTANKKDAVKDREKNAFPISGGIFDNLNSEEDEPKVSGSSARTPLDASSDYTEEDSDATTVVSQKLGGNHVFGGEGNGETNMSLGRKGMMMSLEKILKSSSRFKKAKLTASQSQPEDGDGDDDDDDDEALPFDCVPDSQAS